MVKRTMKLSFLLIIMAFCLSACKNQEQIKVTLDVKDSIEVGETTILKYSSSNEESLEIEWENSNPEVLDFNEETLELKGLAEGESTITARGQGIEKASVTIKVIQSEKVYTITYILNGGKNSDKNPSEYTGKKTIRLEEATREFYVFLGWYNDNGEKIEKIENGATGDIILTAKWEEDQQNKSEYDITFELNGGNWKYDSYQAVVDDLLKDYNTFARVDYTIKNLPFGSWSNINFHNFFYETINGVNMKDKWGWLAEYFGEIGGAANKKACSILNDYSSASTFDSVNSNYKYAVSYEFRAFIKGVKFTENTSYSSADYSLNEIRNGFWGLLNQQQKTEMIQKRDETIELPNPVKPYYVFDGWYKETDFSGEQVSSPVNFKRDTVLYAKWIEEGPVESVSINNKTKELLYDKTLQINWTVLPLDASNPNVDFVSSDESVVSINSKGFMVAVGEGKATITVISQSNSEIKDSFEIVVYKPDRINATYEENSYAVAGENLKINAEYISRSGEEVKLTFESSDPTIATVNADGLVTGHKAGNATIKIKGKDKTLEVGVTIVDKQMSEIMELIVNSHNSNIYVTEDMLVALAYRTDIFGSASDILFNYDYKEVEMLTPLESEGGKGNRPGTKMSSVEFITVHYTAGASPTSDAEATAKYFYNGGADSSIHYCTGNDGIYHCMPDDEVAWHAGDGTGTKFEWIPTGVTQKSSDPTKPVIGVSSDKYFTINGEKTKVLAPGGYDRVLEQYVNPSEKYFTLLGPAVDVFNGEYHIGTTWWCNSQVAEGRICSHGGNNNSIGIESACNQGSDLWYTWQITAQLVAKLMEENDLAINRVVGHNFFSGKNCPQPMLEKEGEIWYQFIECVESEYEIRTKYENAEITCKSNDTKLLKDNGRIASRPEYTTSVSYTVIINMNGQKQTITLSSLIPGIYE